MKTKNRCKLKTRVVGLKILGLTDLRLKNIGLVVLGTDTGTGLFRRTASQQRVRTRQAAGEHRLSMQFARTDSRKHSFAIRTVEPWNKLPESIKKTKSGEAFKNRLKKSIRHEETDRCNGQTIDNDEKE